MEEALLKEYVMEMKNGDMSRFNDFYELTKRSIFYNIYALSKHHETSEDLLQDTYMKFLKELPNIDVSKSIGGYLMVISRNLTLDYFKKNNRLMEFDEDVHGDEHHHNVDYDLLLNRIKGILKDKEFEIFVLHAVNDYTFEEIAKLKHRPLGTILWSYNNAIKKIQKELADEIN